MLNANSQLFIGNCRNWLSKNPIKWKIFCLVFSLYTLNACSGGSQNFSQFPGFSEYFAANTPNDQLPTADEIALLEKYKPTLYKAIDQREPIDFYKDYISHGELYVSGNKITNNVTAEILNQYSDYPDTVFKYTGNYKEKGTTVLYGRIDRQAVEHNGAQHDITFLTYNLVFPVSGILKDLGLLKSIGLGIGGNLNDWHQLDHYVGVTVALLENTPVAMTLQQHNYHTTYLINDANPTIAVDIAVRSNEVYRHTEGQTKHPAVGFLSGDNIEFLTTGKNKPIMAGFDVTNPQVEVSYELLFLPPNDAFYQFKGYLGKHRLLPGRSGPPGADYATLPGLMPRAYRLFTGYRSTDVEKEAELFNELFDWENIAVRENAIAPFQERFFDAISQ